MPNVETMATWGAAVRGAGVTFRDFFQQNTMAVTKPWEPVVQTLTSERAVETFSGMTGVGTLTIFAEGSTIPSAARYKLYDTAFSHKQYGKNLQLTRLNLLNRDWSAQFNEFKGLTIGANTLASKAPAQIFNGAFSNSGVFTLNGVQVTTYADGKNLCSVAHPRVDGGSAQSNASATSTPLTESNFETGRVALMEQLQDDGTPIANMGQVYVVVPLKLEKQAQIITGSTLRSGTANNDINIYLGGGYQVFSSVWLDATNGGSDTAWFLAAPTASKLCFIKRNGPDMDQSIDKGTLSTFFSVVFDFSVGSYDWRGVWGSKGDSSAYSS